MLRPLRVLAILITVALLWSVPHSPARAQSLQQNGTHLVQRGETLSGIGQRYGVPVDTLMEINGISNASLIFAGQRLILPVAQPATAASSNQLDDTVVHVVKPGENLSIIARRYGISLAQLAEANGIADPSLIRAGQRLVLPGSVTTVEATPVSSGVGEYTVQRGDSLASIARAHDTSVDALVLLNRLSDPSRIYTGQRLRLPSYQAPEITGMPESGLRMTVSIGQQRCWVYRNQVLLYEWPCSTGRPGAGTKTGTFYVQSKIREAWGSAFGFYMPYWLGIYWAGSTENGIHGLPYAPGGQPIWASSVGTPVTYGCVLLGEQESKTLWEMADLGMQVTIAY